MLAKDLRRWGRSPLFVWALVLPLALTLLLDSVVGALVDPKPRLGVVSDAAVTSWAESIEGIVTTRVASEAALQQLLLDGRLDAGVVTSAAFVQAVRAGEQPRLDLHISGASSVTNRGIIISGLLGAVRQLAATTPAVDIVVVRLGDEAPAVGVRLLPFVVMLALAMAAGMVPAAGLLEEKDQRTLQALLATPSSSPEVLLAKGAAGWILGVVAGLLTLAIGGVLGDSQAGVLLLAVGLGAVLLAEIGLLVGAWVRSRTALLATWLGVALVLLLPVVPLIWSGTPLWLAKVGPAYYVVRPIYAVTVQGAAADAVTADLAIGAVICAALAAGVIGVGRQLGRRAGQGQGAALAPV